MRMRIIIVILEFGFTRPWGQGPWGGLSCGWSSGDTRSPELRRELSFWMKLLTAKWFLRCDLQKQCNCQQIDVEIELWLRFWRYRACNPCNCQQFDIEIELWTRFWGPWVARIQARANLFSEIVDSYKVFNVLKARPGRGGGRGEPPARIPGGQRV